MRIMNYYYYYYHVNKCFGTAPHALYKIVLENTAKNH